MALDPIFRDEAESNGAVLKLQARLVAANTFQDAAGHRQINHRAVIQGLVAEGHATQAIAYDVQRRAGEKAAIHDLKIQITKSRGQLDVLRNIFEALSRTSDEELPARFDENVHQLRQQGILMPGTVPPSPVSLQQGGVAELRQYISQQWQAAIIVDQLAAAHLKDLDYGVRVVEFHERVLTKTPETEKEWLDNISLLMSRAQTTAQWAAGKTTLGETGAPADVVSQLSDKFSPEAVYAPQS